MARRNEAWHDTLTIPCEGKYKARRSLARDLGVPDNTLARWEKLGYISKGRDGWDGHDVYKVAVERRAQFRTLDVDDESLEPLERKRLADAKISEHKLELLRGDLITTETVREGWNRLVQVWQSRMSAMPGKMADMLEGKQAEEIEDILDAEVRELVTAIGKECKRSIRFMTAAERARKDGDD